jgi:hypothetical protein
LQRQSGWVGRSETGGNQRGGVGRFGRLQEGGGHEVGSAARARGWDEGRRLTGSAIAVSLSPRPDSGMIRRRHAGSGIIHTGVSIRHQRPLSDGSRFGSTNASSSPAPPSARRRESCFIHFLVALGRLPNAVLRVAFRRRRFTQNFGLTRRLERVLREGFETPFERPSFLLPYLKARGAEGADQLPGVPETSRGTAAEVSSSAPTKAWRADRRRR